MEDNKILERIMINELLVDLFNEILDIEEDFLKKVA